MMIRGRILVIGLGLASLLLAPAVVRADDSVEFYDYTIRPGDSCVRIAIRELGDRKGYREIHKHNRLGPLPHNLVPGKTLRLPRKTRRPDASLTDKQGAVRVRSPDKSWAAANQGMDLFRHWRVNTKNDATAAVDFRDRSRLRLRERTTVILYGPSKAKARRTTERAFLETGALRTYLGPGTSKPIAIASAAAMAEFGRGSALVQVDKKKIARVSNHQGSAVRVRSKGVKGAVSVKSGFGTKVEAGKSPTPPKPLPNPPTFTAMGRTLPAVAGRGLLSASWQPAASAVRYRVRVSTDPEGKSPIAVGDVDGKQTSVTVADVPAGRYFLAVASIDGDDFEGRFSDVFEIRLVAMDGSSAASATSGLLLPLGAKSQSLRVPRGTTLATFPTLSCVVRVGGKASPITKPLPAGGPASLECLDGRGQRLPVIELNVGG